MRIGFVSYWFPRGQATVTRFIKSIFDEAGHDTFVLARRGNLARNSGDWEAHNLTIGPKEYDIPYEVYEKWAKNNNLDVIFFFQNYQFDEIQKLKERGIQTIGSFMWEQFGEKHIPGASRAYSQLYSLHKSEFVKYKKGYGLNTKLIRWGIHPDLYIKPQKPPKEITFHFPCGYNSPRKGTDLLIKAFNKVNNPNLRLIITEANRRKIDPRGDNRIIIEKGTVPLMRDFLYNSSKCHAYIIPSKWEGLGMAFLEAIAMGRPIITTDAPPMSDYVRHKKTGLLVNSNAAGRTGSKLPIYEIDVDSMASAIKLMSDPRLLKRMSKNTIELQKEYNWSKTKEDILGLIK